MRKVIKFQNNKKPVIVTKQGVQYKRMDLGGYTIDVRVKSADELKGDVELFRKKGELLIHAQLLSCVHLVSFEKGKLEIRISGNTDKSNAKDMSSHLKHWTGISWIVNLVEEKGNETLDEKNNTVRQK